MITFETQEEFESAVMEVLRNRLILSVFTNGNYVRVKLDDHWGEMIAEDSDG